jgi:hypothetical protein
MRGACCSAHRLGRSTARHFAWPEVIQRVLLPRVELERMRTAEGV